jgi:hypothetical protein
MITDAGQFYKEIATRTEKKQMPSHVSRTPANI